MGKPLPKIAFGSTKQTIIDVISWLVVSFGPTMGRPSLKSSFVRYRWGPLCTGNSIETSPPGCSWDRNEPGKAVSGLPLASSKIAAQGKSKRAKFNPSRPAEPRFSVRILAQVVANPCVQSCHETMGEGPENWL